MAYQAFFERVCCLFVLGFLSLGLIESPALAQNAAPEKAVQKTLKPVETELITKDDVRLQVTYYPSGLGKDAIPIIIVHDSKTDRNAYNGLALALQAEGHAVLVPDMRGFGQSTKIKQLPGQPDKTFDARKMSTVGFGRIVTHDMETLKSFLKSENDNSKLNLNQLCVIGVGDLGSAVAVNWTFGDWNFKDLNAIKQSKDVHALILISPETNYKNLQIPKILLPLAQIEGPNKTSAEKLSFFFIVGAGKPGAKVKPKDWREASDFAGTVARFHPEPPKNDIKADKTLFFGEMPTTLQASDLLKPEMLKTNVQIEGFQPVPLQSMILTFIDWRIREKAKEFPWSSRKIPGG